MKYIYCLLLWAASVQAAVAQSNTDKEVIKKLMSDSFDEIFSPLDATKMDQFYTADFLLLEEGAVWNRDTLSNLFERIRIARKDIGLLKRINKLEFITVHVADTMAWIVYYNQGVWQEGDAYVDSWQWLESAALIKTKAGWRIQMLHSTTKKEGKP